MQLKNREIVYAQGYTGYEGGVGGDHDWLCVDCHNIVVHIMLPGMSIYISHVYKFIKTKTIVINYMFLKMQRFGRRWTWKGTGQQMNDLLRGPR